MFTLFRQFSIKIFTVTTVWNTGETGDINTTIKKIVANYIHYWTYALPFPAMLWLLVFSYSRRSLRSYFGSSVEQMDNMGLVSFVENIHRKRRVTVTDRISHADCLLEMEKKRKKKMENGKWKMTPADPDSNLAL